MSMLLYCFRLIAILRRLGAYIRGLNRAESEDISKIASVASFFLKLIATLINALMTNSKKVMISTVGKLRSGAK